MDIMGNRSILQVALDVHMTQTGAYERDHEKQRDDVKVLLHVLQNWKPTTHKRYEYFDNAVHDLIWITISDLGWAMEFKLPFPEPKMLGKDLGVRAF